MPYDYSQTAAVLRHSVLPGIALPRPAMLCAAADSSCDLRCPWKSNARTAHLKTSLQSVLLAFFWQLLLVCPRNPSHLASSILLPVSSVHYPVACDVSEHMFCSSLHCEILPFSLWQTNVCFLTGHTGCTKARPSNHFDLTYESEPACLTVIRSHRWNGQ